MNERNPTIHITKLYTMIVMMMMMKATATTTISMTMVLTMDVAMKGMIHSNVGKTIQLELQFMSNHLNANKAKLFHISSTMMRDIFKGRFDFM